MTFAQSKLCGGAGCAKQSCNKVAAPLTMQAPAIGRSNTGAVIPHLTENHEPSFASCNGLQQQQAPCATKKSAPATSSPCVMNKPAPASVSHKLLQQHRAVRADLKSLPDDKEWVPEMDGPLCDQTEICCRSLKVLVDECKWKVHAERECVWH
jgi:hypothetical protein